MSADKDVTYDERQHVSLLDNEEDVDSRTNSELIQEDADQLISPVAGPEQDITRDEETRDEIKQDDESENGTNPNYDGTDHGKNQMMSVVLISIMIVLVAVTFSQSLSPYVIPKYDNPSPTSQDILIVYMLVGLLIIVAMFLRKQAITEKSTGVKKRGARGKIKHILRDYLSIVGMSFFFPFACILDLSHIIATFGCDEIWRLGGGECYEEYLLDWLFHPIRILFMAAELAFCCKFHGTRFKENGLVRCGLMVVLAANLGLWFLSLVYEMTEQGGRLEGEGRKCSNKTGHMQSHKVLESWNACVTKTSSAHEVMYAMNGYLYPFAIEFSLLVMEFLVTKFVSSTQRKTRGPAKCPTTGSHLDFAQQPETPGSDHLVVAQQLLTSGYQGLDQSTPVCASGHPIAKLGQLLSVFIIAIGLLASFLYISLAVVYSFANARNTTETDSMNWENFFNTYYTINYLLIDVLIVVGYVCGYGLEIQKKKLHGLDWLVLISAFGPIMFKFILVTAMVASYTDLSSTDFSAILICGQVANLVELILQAPFLFLSDRWRLTVEQRSQPRYLCREKILKAIILCLAVTNVTTWISDSIIFVHSSPSRDELTSTIYTVNNMRIMRAIFLPLFIFYEFNSFLLFMRAYLGD